MLVAPAIRTLTTAVPAEGSVINAASQAMLTTAAYAADGAFIAACPTGATSTCYLSYSCLCSCYRSLLAYAAKLLHGHAMHAWWLLFIRLLCYACMLHTYDGYKPSHTHAVHATWAAMQPNGPAYACCACYIS